MSKARRKKRMENAKNILNIYLSMHHLMLVKVVN